METSLFNLLQKFFTFMQMQQERNSEANFVSKSKVRRTVLCYYCSLKNWEDLGELKHERRVPPCQGK